MSILPREASMCAMSVRLSKHKDADNDPLTNIYYLYETINTSSAEFRMTSFVRFAILYKNGLLCAVD